MTRDVPPGITYFEKRDPARNISKWWALRLIDSAVRPNGTAYRLWWGRIGTTGQTKAFECATDDAVLTEATARAEDKLREGYREVRSCYPSAPFLVGLPAEPAGLPKSIFEPGTWLIPKRCAARDSDGWELDERGRSVRPLGRGERRKLEDLRQRARQPPAAPVRREPARREPVLGAGPRVIDFEE